MKLLGSNQHGVRIATVTLRDEQNVTITAAPYLRTYRAISGITALGSDRLLPGQRFSVFVAISTSGAKAPPVAAALFSLS